MAPFLTILASEISRKYNLVTNLEKHTFLQESKNKVIVACTDGTEIMVPGPGGDLSQGKGEDAAVGHKPKKPVRPPSDLQVGSYLSGRALVELQ